MRQKSQTASRRQITLGQWLIEKTDTDSWRAGKVTGFKHPEVDQEMITAVGRKNLLEQAAALEQEGLITVEWKDVRTDIRRIHFDVKQMDRLCEREGIENPRRRLENVRKTVWKWRGRTQAEWLISYYDNLLGKLDAGKLPQNAEDEELFCCLNAIADLKQDVWKRVFSARIFRNSKHFENFCQNRVLTILRNYSPLCREGMEDVEILAEHRIMTYSQTLEWKGAVIYRILRTDGTEESRVDTSGQLWGTMLNAQTLSHALPVAAERVREVITIENKANYEAMEFAPSKLYIYAHGFFSPKERIFLNELRQILPVGVCYRHWGDMDYGGIRIFQFIRQHVFPEAMPLHMDRKTYAAALQRGAGIALEEEKRKKLEQMDAGALEELKACILEKGMEIEQEMLMT